MLFKNVSAHALKLASECLDESAWGESKAARPPKVTIPPGKVVAIKDEFGLRSRAVWGQHEDGDAPTAVIKSRIEQLTNGQLKPHDVDSIDKYEHTFHDQIPAVARTFAELERAGKAAAGSASAADTQAQIAEAVRREVERLAPAPPMAVAKLADS